jgi:hypothetical protein
MISIERRELTLLKSLYWKLPLSKICPNTKCIKNKCLDTIYIDVNTSSVSKLRMTNKKYVACIKQNTWRQNTEKCLKTKCLQPYPKIKKKS